MSALSLRDHAERHAEGDAEREALGDLMGAGADRDAHAGTECDEQAETVRFQVLPLPNFPEDLERAFRRLGNFSSRNRAPLHLTF